MVGTRGNIMCVCVGGVLFDWNIYPAMCACARGGGGKCMCALDFILSTIYITIGMRASARVGLCVCVTVVNWILFHMPIYYIPYRNVHLAWLCVLNS